MYRCPICGGEAVDESGNDAYVCLSCGKLFDPEAVIDEEQEQKDAEKQILKDMLKVEDALSERSRKITRLTVLITVFLCVAVTAVCLVKALRVSDNPYEGYNSKYGDPYFSDSILEEVEHEYPAIKTTITEDVLKEDYKQYYGNRGKPERNTLIVTALVADLLIIFVGATILAVKKILIRRRHLNEEETENAKVLFFGGAFILVIVFALLGIYFNTKNISPKNADYRLYKIEYLGKTTSSNSFGDVRSESYYIRFMKEGKEITKIVSEEEYNIFPNWTGTYYVGVASDGTTHVIFCVYSDKEYEPGVFLSDYE